MYGRRHDDADRGGAATIAVPVIAIIREQSVPRGTLDTLEYTVAVTLPGSTKPTLFENVKPPAWRRWRVLEDDPNDPLEFEAFPVGARVQAVAIKVAWNKYQVELAEREHPVTGTCA